MTPARSGFGGVRADARRPLIPDLPAQPYPISDGDTDVGFASRVVVAYFGLLLIAGMALWYTFSTGDPRPIAVEPRDVPYLAR